MSSYLVVIKQRMNEVMFKPPMREFDTYQATGENKCSEVVESVKK